MLASAVKSAQLGSYLDAVLSVDSVRVYKPRSDVYRLVTQGISATSRDVIFASSNRWDVMGARAFGFRTIWVNRGNLPEEYPHRRGAGGTGFAQPDRADVKAMTSKRFVEPQRPRQ